VKAILPAGHISVAGQDQRVDPYCRPTGDLSSFCSSLLTGGRGSQRFLDRLPNPHRPNREHVQSGPVPDNRGVIQPLDQVPPDLTTGGRHVRLARIMSP